ncbi:MAG: four helix bundle protein [Bacteroidota bacterium]
MEEEALKIGKRRVLSEKISAFVLKYVNFSGQLKLDRKALILSHQLLMSGTTIAISSKKAQQADVKANFMYKFAIANKEASKICCWESLIKHSKIKEKVVKNLISAIEELKTTSFLSSQQPT